MKQAQQYKDKNMREPLMMSIISHSTGAVVGYKAIEKADFPLEMLANIYNLAGPLKGAP